MIEKTGKATVTHEDRMIPIAYDGACSSVPLAAPTIENALTSFEWKPGYVGFQFVDAVKATITTDDGKEEKFERERVASLRHIFAEAVMTADQVKAATDEASVQFRQYSSYALDDKANLFYSTGKAIKTLDKYDQESTILVNRQGQKLFTPKNG